MTARSQFDATDRAGHGFAPMAPVVHLPHHSVGNVETTNARNLDRKNTMTTKAPVNVKTTSVPPVLNAQFDEIIGLIELDVQVGIKNNVRLGQFYTQFEDVLEGEARTEILHGLIAAQSDRPTLGVVDVPMPADGLTPRQQLASVLYWQYPDLLQTSKKGGAESLASARMGRAKSDFKVSQRKAAAAEIAANPDIVFAEESTDPEVKTPKFSAAFFTALYAQAHEKDERTTIIRLCNRMGIDGKVINKAITKWAGEATK